MVHYAILVVATGGVETGLPLISLSDANQMIGITEIEFCEDFSPLELVKNGGHKWEWVPVLDGDVIQCSL